MVVTETLSRRYPSRRRKRVSQFADFVVPESDSPSSRQQPAAKKAKKKAKLVMKRSKNSKKTQAAALAAARSSSDSDTPGSSSDSSDDFSMLAPPKPSPTKALASRAVRRKRKRASPASSSSSSSSSPPKLVPSAPKRKRARESPDQEMSDASPTVSNEFEAVPLADWQAPSSSDAAVGDIQDLCNRLSVGSLPHQLACRRSQRATIKSFVSSHVEERRGGSLYICGSPGTGKSACVSNVMQSVLEGYSGEHSVKKQMNSTSSVMSVRTDDGCQVRAVSFNAMSLPQPNALYFKLLQLVAPSQAAQLEAGLATDGSPGDATSRQLAFASADALAALMVPDRATMSSSSSSDSDDSSSMRRWHRRVFVVVIDEIDGLLSQAQSVLYRLFEWPLAAQSRLVLIGIANAMALTDRFLPRLRARDCAPQELIFPSYTKEELLSILESRIGFKAQPLPADDADDADDEPEMQVALFEKAALELCARKVASRSGDVRKSLDLCVSCLRTAEQSILDAQEKAPDAPFDVSKHLVTLRHMSRALSASLGSRHIPTIRGLPKQQKIVLCVAAATFGHTRNHEVSLRQFEEIFKRFAKILVLPTSTSREFVDMLSLMQDAGLISLKKRRGGRGSRQSKRSVALNVQPDDVEFALEDEAYFLALLHKANKCAQRLIDAKSSGSDDSSSE